LSETLGYAVGETVYKYETEVAGVIAEGIATSPELILAQNHPNPFRHATAIAYTLARDAKVKLTIHDALGRTILTRLEGNRLRGNHELAWDARDWAGQPVGAGVYFYRLETDQGDAQEKKLLVVK
jgi:hypothetical protein